MTLREEYEKEVDRLSEENLYKPSIVSSLFKKSNQHYIAWLEAELKKLRVADVIKNEVAVCDCGNWEVEAYSPCCSLSCWHEKFE